MSAVHLPADVDSECRALCEAMNALPGIETVESCCGHGKEPFRIWFIVRSLKYLPRLVYYIVPCHVGFLWKCFVTTDCGMSPVHFCMESLEKGEDAYRQAQQMAANLRAEMVRP